MGDKIFEINEFGVCINPNEIIFNDKQFTVKVKTAIIDDFWYYGIETNIGESTYSSCVSKDCYWFNTEKECINAGIIFLNNRGFKVRNQEEQMTFEDMLCN